MIDKIGGKVSYAVLRFWRILGYRRRLLPIALVKRPRPNLDFWLGETIFQ
jgi:hypothetical protein